MNLSHPKKPQLSIIIVNWNVRELLHECLVSVKRGMLLPREDYEVIVVDNASADGSCEMVKQRHPDVLLIESPENLGFARGCNLGFESALGQFIMLLNPDTLIVDHAIDILLADLKDHPETAVVGARMTDEFDQFRRESGGAFTNLHNLFWHWFFLDRILPRWLGPKPNFIAGDPRGRLNLDWVSGADMLIRREAIVNQLLDESYFAYGEDMDICYRLKSQGWKIAYQGAATIIHHLGRSFEQQSEFSVLMAIHKGPRSFFIKTNGLLAGYAFDLIMLAGFLIRWPAFRLASLFARGRGLRKQAEFSRRYVAITLQHLLNLRPPVPAAYPTQHQAVIAREKLDGQAPLFSVIMNVYNGEKYVAQAINSVLRQTCEDWEIVVWDDLSTDRTFEICQSFADPRIRCFRGEEHLKIGQARNRAIEMARGEWLAFLDQDDLWEPFKLERQKVYIDEDRDNSLGLLYGRTMQFHGRERWFDFDPWHEFSRLPTGDIFNELLRKPSFICLSSTVIRRSAVSEFGGIATHIDYCPDFYLCVEILKHYRAEAVQETCCWYRVHDTNMTAAYRIPIYVESLEIIENCASLVDPKVLKTRQSVHHSLIGFQEVFAQGRVLAGLGRIVRRGSVVYLLFRPVLHGVRLIRRFAGRLWRPGVRPSVPGLLD